MIYNHIKKVDKSLSLRVGLLLVACIFGVLLIEKLNFFFGNRFIHSFSLAIAFSYLVANVFQRVDKEKLDIKGALLFLTFLAVPNIYFGGFFFLTYYILSGSSKDKIFIAITCSTIGFAAKLQLIEPFYAHWIIVLCLVALSVSEIALGKTVDRVIFPILTIINYAFLISKIDLDFLGFIFCLVLLSGMILKKNNTSYLLFLLTLIVLCFSWALNFKSISHFYVLVVSSLAFSTYGVQFTASRNFTRKIVQFLYSLMLLTVMNKLSSDGSAYNYFYLVVFLILFLFSLSKIEKNKLTLNSILNFVAFFFWLYGAYSK